jgi:peptidoglycan/LPS O-acetylase OafA/YrhL
MIHQAIDSEGKEQQAGHLVVLDLLRGLAAISVCMFHFMCGNPGFLHDSDPVKAIAAYGWLGVQSFFVISGFVIPYAMYKRKYKINQSLNFWIRRAIRIEPPYFACILLVIALNYASMMVPGFQGIPFRFRTAELLSHVAYLNAFTGEPWYNPVFWTLAIEFQYYVFIAIIFPLLVHRSTWLRTSATIVIALMGLASFCFPEQLTAATLPHWLPLFCVGIVAFQFYTGQIAALRALLIGACCSAIAGLINGIPHAAVGTLTALLIVLVKPTSTGPLIRTISLFGLVSYSLYLTHVPIGGRVINLSMRFSAATWFRYSMVGVAFLTSWLFAYYFWRLIERPCQVASKMRPWHAKYS